MGAAAAVAGIGAAASIGTGLMASQTAANSSKQAADLQKMQYLIQRGDLSPFVSEGQSVLPAYNALALSGPTGGGPNYVDMAYNQYLPPRMTQAELEQTPGYQFVRDQGLKAVQSSMAARGLGVSGASLKGAADFATGLANKTYQDQFNLAQQRFKDVLGLNEAQQGQITNQFNRINEAAKLGANAAAGLGSQGTALANQAGNALSAVGTAQGAGIQGIGNAVNQGLQNYLMYNRYQQQTNPTTTPTPSNYNNPAIDPANS